eukprot:c12507_g1_i1.p1 GENE.c12507_g1_i1~~c12507_g1_i1.p1  ORF type:complete len:212 (+),score=83.20 c12507_g1_i1:65-700(+)
MGGVFGKKQTPHQISKQDLAILDLKNARDTAKKYTQQLEGLIQKQEESAKILLKKGEREKAKRILKLKKYQSKILEQTNNQLQNLEEMIGTIEFAQIEQQVFSGLKAGNDALKLIHKEMSIEKVQQLMDDTEESLEYQREIDSILSQNSSLLDDESLLDELSQLESEYSSGLLGEAPQVPQNVVVQPQKQKVEEPKQQSSSKTQQREAALA